MSSPGDLLGGIAWPFADLDADEVILRVHRYYPDLRPANYCCIIKHRHRTKGWAIAIEADPSAALLEAIWRYREQQRGKPKARSHVWDRVPLIEAEELPAPRAVTQDIEDMLG